MSYLEGIQCPDDLKKLNLTESRALCAEIRSFLIQSVAKTGGHLASNLGIVEITVALHRVFDTSRDRLVFDVGHQCYVHKLLTGRREAFPSLRQFHGLSGFPKPDESIHDAFVSGHASTAVSAALGMARARKSPGEYHVIAVMGDGALTGGLAYEALNDAGQSRQPMIVLLNDNGMSITENVGGIAKTLAKARLKPQYFKLKDIYHKIVYHLPGGRHIHRMLHQLKTAVKTTFLPSSIFEDMGFTYYGPCDGHNVEELEKLLRLARNIKGPVLIHLRTVKGKGYTPAEDNPCVYHGVSAFDYVVGVNNDNGGSSFTDVFGEKIVSLARQNNKVCAITAAMEAGTGLEKFASQYPERFYDVGIAEGHAVTMAAGMAKQGMTPVCAIYSTFLQRAYDMLLHDVCLSGLHVVLAVDRAGLVGSDGETHHGLFDIGFLSQMPGMKIYAPSNYPELAGALELAVNKDSGPVAVRYPRGKAPDYNENRMTEPYSILTEGEDLTLVTYGRLVRQCMDAAEISLASGIRVRLIKLNIISPIDESLIELLGRSSRLIIAEECAPGGTPLAVDPAQLLKSGHHPQKYLLLNTGSRFIPQGDTARLLQYCRLDARSIADAIAEVTR